MSALGAGQVPLVSAKKIDNGYKDFVDTSKSDKKIFNGHCLTINNDGDGGAGLAYYQPCKMALDSHVTALYPKIKLSKYIQQFIVGSILRQRGKFGHGYSLNDRRIKAFKLILPIKSDSTPDFDFMENYMKKQEQSLIRQVKKLLSSRVMETVKACELDTEWKEFYISDVAEIVSGRDIYEAERVEGLTPYATASAQNNGIRYFVDNTNETLENGCISVNRNGSVGYAFYHDYSALFGNDCRKLRPKIKSKYISLFITTQITAQREKYGYGYKMGTGRLKRQKILLPVKSYQTPNYEFMENYMKYEEYKQVKKYLDFFETKSVY